MNTWYCADGLGAVKVNCPSGVTAKPIRFSMGTAPPEPMATSYSCAASPFAHNVSRCDDVSTTSEWPLAGHAVNANTSSVANITVFYIGAMRMFLVAVLMMTGCAHVPRSKSELEAQVTETERAFAKSMADRDAKAFRALLSSEAVFFGRKPLRGPDAVMAVWQKFFAGPAAPFSWAPETVEVLPSGTLAYSTGPVRDPGGTVIATYSSVWRLEGDGRWRIVFDHGCDACACAAEKNQ